MRLHKEGHKIVLFSFLILATIIVLLLVLSSRWTLVHWLVSILLAATWLFIVSFFRIPNRKTQYDDHTLCSPADGMICTVEEVFEKEYVNSKCLLVSVFMNGTDVHNNFYPCDGMVEYVNFQRGNYFVASAPKSSDVNERCSVGLKMDTGEKILIRQIAGLMARRIVCYAKEGDRARQNQEFGFIKFGSRVDLYLPLGTKVLAEMHKQIHNQLSFIARTPEQQKQMAQ